MRMKNQIAAWAAALLISAIPAFASSEDQQGQGQAVVTVLPNKNVQAAPVPQQGLSVKVNGKESNITGWQQFGPNTPIEMVVLIDGSARTTLGAQMGDISHFIQGLPANVSVTLAYMENGRAVFTGPLSTDRAAVVRGLHITGMPPGIDGSPYFSLSDLAKHWPSNNSQARREVVMLTDGVDYYDSARHYDPEDPYLQAAITDAVRAKMIVYSIYWQNTGRLDRSMMATNAGQNLLIDLTQATGGNTYWFGYGNPVNLGPYFEDITHRLNNQYEMSFMAPSNGKPQVDSFQLKAKIPGMKVDSPQQVLVTASETAAGQQ